MDKTTRLTLLSAACFFTFSLAVAARAAETYVVDGLALKGHDPVAYFTDGRATPGQAALRAEHGGAAYLFASAANREAFLAAPAKYLPQYGGYCAFGVSRGYKADIDPRAFSVVEGKLYLNYNAQVQRDWLKDTSGYIRTADGKWPEVRTSTRVLK